MSSTTRSAVNDDSDSLPYGFAKGVLQACKEALKKRDGVIATRKKAANSSSGRSRKNLVQKMPPVDLLAEMLRRHKVEARRAYRREYMREWRKNSRRS